jgi:hypothetical protein
VVIDPLHWFLQSAGCRPLLNAVVCGSRFPSAPHVFRFSARRLQTDTARPPQVHRFDRGPPCKEACWGSDPFLTVIVGAHSRRRSEWSALSPTLTRETGEQISISSQRERITTWRKGCRPTSRITIRISPFVCCSACRAFRGFLAGESLLL